MLDFAAPVAFRLRRFNALHPRTACEIFSRMRAPTQKRGGITRDRLLDEAEKLFAQHGFDGVSVRDITKAAGVDVALANYHFGSKDKFFDAVFQRRAEAMNARRIVLLDDAVERYAPEPPPLEDVIGAFTWPVAEVMIEGGDGGRAYGRLVAQVNNSPKFARMAMTRYFDPVVKRFMEVLRTILPNCREEELYWSYHFLSGALTLSMAETGRLDMLSDGHCRSDDLKAIFARMAPFCAAGFRALCKD
jgi:AcrR family transcriptional regulator